MFLKDRKIDATVLLLIILLVGILAGCNNTTNDYDFDKEVLVSTEDSSNSEEDDTEDNSNIYTLVSGDGYTIISRRKESFQGDVIEYGVKYNGEFVLPFSSSHIFNQRDEADADCDEYLYLGENTFMAYKDCEIVFADGVQRGTANPSGRGIVYLYNAKLNKSLVYGGAISITLYNEGYFIIAHKDFHDAIVTIIDNEFNECGTTVIDVGNTCPSLGPFSEGLFYFDGCFYNSLGQKRIDLGQFTPTFIFFDAEKRVFKSPYFQNGKCYVELKNPNGVEYYTEIDVNGEFLYEPIKK